MHDPFIWRPGVIQLSKIVCIIRSFLSPTISRRPLSWNSFFKVEDFRWRYRSNDLQSSQKGTATRALCNDAQCLNGYSIYDSLTRSGNVTDFGTLIRIDGYGCFSQSNRYDMTTPLSDSQLSDPSHGILDVAPYQINGGAPSFNSPVQGQHNKDNIETDDDLPEVPYGLHAGSWKWRVVAHGASFRVTDLYCHWYLILI